MIAGPAGALQLVVEGPDAQSPAAFMVVCHPHPLHGGTMDNKIVTTLARCAHELDMPSIRFNFRGVGNSEGSFDDGRGETLDTQAVIDYGRHTWPQASLWLGGFSFGGRVALRASTAPQVGRVDNLVTVAPAFTGDYASPQEVRVPHCPWLIVQGDADEVIDPVVNIDWAGRMNPAPQLVVLPGVGHFFHGQLGALRDVVVPFLSDRPQ
ncbi:MAG: alpha/beta fold hydrolase [Pseudomonadota bacterium]